MPSLLITGAGRGLGLEFARQCAADGWRVHACLRDPAKAGPLKALTGDVRVHRLDPCDAAQIKALVAALGLEPLDLLIANHGAYGPRAASIDAVATRDWLEVFRVNSIAPLKVATALADRVAAGQHRQMVFISSRMGSIADAGSGAYPYRMSKAALNDGVKILSLELAPRQITCLLLSPGWVRTDMGGAGAAIDPATSVAGMRKVIAELRPADNGRFLDYQGKEIPW